MFTVYLKPTNYCNVGCEHCYLTTEVRADKSRMSNETLEATGQMLNRMQVLNRKTKSHIIWHGGEPLVLKPDWYWKAGAILDKELPGHSQSMQTSLIPYNTDYAELLKTRMGGWVGSSIDFSSRMLKGSPEAYQRFWMEKVDLARADGIKVVPGIVPARPEINKAAWIVEWMAEREFFRFRMERYNSFGFMSLNRPSNREHSQFLIELFDAVMRYLETHDKIIAVGTIEAAIRGVLLGLPGDRWGGTCQSDFLVIEPDGSLNTCPDRTSREAPYSNVHEGAEHFIQSEPRRKWIRIQHAGHSSPGCVSCEFNGFCKTYCPITPHEKGECAGNKTFLLYVKSVLSTEIGLALASRYIKGTDNYFSKEASYYG